MVLRLVFVTYFCEGRAYYSSNSKILFQHLQTKISNTVLLNISFTLTINTEIPDLKKRFGHQGRNENNRTMTKKESAATMIKKDPQVSTKKMDLQ